MKESGFGFKQVQRVETEENKDGGSFVSPSECPGQEAKLGILIFLKLCKVLLDCEKISLWQIQRHTQYVAIFLLSVNPKAQILLFILF